MLTTPAYLSAGLLAALTIDGILKAAFMAGLIFCLVLMAVAACMAVWPYLK